MTPWRHDHAKARSLIEKGLRAQRMIAHELLDAGLTVRLPVPAYVVPEHGNNIDNVARFADVADILLGPRMKIEVKERGFTFTGPDDFPYETCMMGDLPSWRDLRTPPVATIVLSNSGGRMVVPTPPILGSSIIPSGWFVQSNYDSQRDIAVESVFAPRAYYRSWDVFLGWAHMKEDES